MDCLKVGMKVRISLIIKESYVDDGTGHIVKLPDEKDNLLYVQFLEPYTHAEFISGYNTKSSGFLRIDILPGYSHKTEVKK